MPILSSAEVERAPRKAGFIFAPKRGKGSHIAYCKAEKDKKRLVIIPRKKDIPRGTLSAILEQAGLSRDDFSKLLKRWEPVTNGILHKRRGLPAHQQEN